MIEQDGADLIDLTDYSKVTEPIRTTQYVIGATVVLPDATSMTLKEAKMCFSAADFSARQRPPITANILKNHIIVLCNNPVLGSFTWASIISTQFDRFTGN